MIERILVGVWVVVLFLGGLMSLGSELAAGATLIVGASIMALLSQIHDAIIRNREVLERTEDLFNRLYQAREAKSQSKQPE